MPLAPREAHDQRQERAISIAYAFHLDRAPRTVRARQTWTPTDSSSSFSRVVAQRTYRLVVKLFLHDARQLLFHVVLQEFHQGRETDLLVHDGHTPIRLVARHNQSGEQNFLELLVGEVGEGEVAKLLHDGVFTSAEHCLSSLVHEAEVPDEQECLVEQLLGVFVLLVVLMGVHQQVVHEVVEVVQEERVFKQDLLHKCNVHAHNIVENLHADDCQAQESLGDGFGNILLCFETVDRGLELFTVRQKKGGNHADNSKELCILHHEQIVLAKLIVSLVCRSVPCVSGDDGGECL